MWITLILNNWKILFGFVAGLTFGFYVTSQWDAHVLKSALKQQENALNAQCDADKKLTSEVSNDYQNKIAALNRRIANLKRMQPNTCVSFGVPTGGRDGGTGAGEHGGPNVISTESLIDYSAIAERHRLQLISCQDFIRKERLTK